MQFSAGSGQKFNTLGFSTSPRAPNLRKDFTIYKFEKTISVFREEMNSLIDLLLKLSDQSELKILNNIDVEFLIAEMKTAPATKNSLEHLTISLRNCWPDEVKYKNKIMMVLKRYTKDESLAQFKDDIENALLRLQNTKHTIEIEVIQNYLIRAINTNIELIASRIEGNCSPHKHNNLKKYFKKHLTWFLGVNLSSLKPCQ
jgi:hypothetical protein